MPQPIRGPNISLPRADRGWLLAVPAEGSIGTFVMWLISPGLRENPEEPAWVFVGTMFGLVFGIVSGVRARDYYRLNPHSKMIQVSR